jgi:hypothetical protein
MEYEEMKYCSPLFTHAVQGKIGLDIFSVFCVYLQASIVFESLNYDFIRNIYC